MVRGAEYDSVALDSVLVCAAVSLPCYDTFMLLTVLVVIALFPREHLSCVMESRAKELALRCRPPQVRIALAY